MVRRRKNDRGQAVVEYILMLSIVVFFFSLLMGVFSRTTFVEKLLKFLKEDYAFTYKYGHPKARGFDEGSPVMHPRVPSGENFRIFINPRRR